MLADFGLGLDAATLVGVDRTLTHQLNNVRGTLGTAGYFLVNLQVAGSLFHHYMLHDGTFARMVLILRAKLKDLR